MRAVFSMKDPEPSSIVGASGGRGEQDRDEHRPLRRCGVAGPCRLPRCLVATERGRLGRRRRGLVPGGRCADPEDPDCAQSADGDRGADQRRRPLRLPRSPPTSRPRSRHNGGRAAAHNGGHKPPTLHNNGGNNNGGNNNGGNNNSGGSNNNPPATHSSTVSTSVPYVPPPAAPSTPVAQADQAAAVDTDRCADHRGSHSGARPPRTTPATSTRAPTTRRPTTPT